MMNSSINLEHWEKGESLVNGGLGCEDALYVRVGAVVEERDRLREAMEAMLENVKTVKHYATYTVCRDSWIAMMQEALKNEA